MTITLEIPEKLAATIDPPAASRHFLESLVLDAFRKSRITGPEAARMLGMERLEWEQFLDDNHVMEGAYSVADLAADIDTMRQKRLEGKLRPA